MAMLPDDAVLEQARRYELVAVCGSFAETRALSGAIAGALWATNVATAATPWDATSFPAVRGYTSAWVAIVSWEQVEERTVLALRRLASLTLPTSLGGEKWEARAALKPITRKTPPELPSGADTPDEGFLASVERLFDRGADAAESVAGSGAVAVGIGGVAWAIVGGVLLYWMWRESQS